MSSTASSCPAAALAQAPRLAERLQAGQRAARVAGTVDLPNFFRTPYGPGWALVGDAGYHRDPLTAEGISDAFRDAQLLSDAIDAGLAGRQPKRWPATSDGGTRRRRRCMS